MRRVNDPIWGEVTETTMVLAIEAYRRGECSAIKSASGANWLIVDDEAHFVVEETGKRATFECFSGDWPWVMRDYKTRENW